MARGHDVALLYGLLIGAAGRRAEPPATGGTLGDWKFTTYLEDDGT